MLSSKEIREIKFSKAVGGYKQDEVDVLLDKVEADYETYERNIRELNAAVEALKKENEGYKSSQNSIQNVLLSAQKLADQIVDEARAKSEAILNDAKGSVERISKEEKELSAAFEEKANSRRMQIERELETAVKNAELKKKSVEAACEDAVRRQQMLFDKTKLEIVAFKTEIRQKYKEHLELLQKLPDEVPSDPKQIAQAVSAIIDQKPDAASFAAAAAATPEPVKAEEPSPVHIEDNNSGFQVSVPESKIDDKIEEDGI